MADLVSMARELGKAIQADERYKEYRKYNDINDKDADLQKLINDFNLKRINLNSKMKDSADSKEIAQLNSEVKALYEQIMTNENMAHYQTAKQEFDKMLSEIDTVINLSANGEDPETCPTSSGCGGACSSCAGCG